METSKLAKLAFRELDRLHPVCCYQFSEDAALFGDRTGGNLYRIATFSHNHEMETPLRQYNPQTPSSIRQ